MHEVDKEVVKVDPPRISVSLGFKMNMGNYENAQVGISVSASAREDETAAKAVDRVYELVETKLVEKFNDLKNELGEAGLGEK